MPAPVSRLDRIWSSLSPAEWARAGALAGSILLLHLLGWGILLLAVVPRHFSIGNGVFGIGLGVTAYTLGMRHAFDADHIAAIDNTTRKFMAEGKRPLSVGFFFSLGHSTVVFVLALLLTLGLRVVGAVQNDASTLHQITGVVGPLVSGTFLYLIAALNLGVLFGILKVFRRMRGGDFDEESLEAHLANRGFMNRFLGKATKRIREPWQMYPLGILFGLGFDTATEVGLLVATGTAVAAGLPWYAILCLPLLFAAGMSLWDTLDGSFMNFAYGWAFSKPVRKVFYNIAITSLSVAVAFGIGTIELAQILQHKLSLGGPFWRLVSRLDLNVIGYGVVVLFALTWAAALLVWRFGRIEEKWSANLQSGISD